MKIMHLANQTITISRLQTLSNDKTTYLTVTSDLVNLQALDSESSERMTGVFGKAYKIYCDSDIDVAVGDKIRDEDGNKYEIASGGISRQRYGSMDFFEIIIIKLN